MENNELRKEILKAIDKNSRFSYEDLGEMLGVSANVVEAEMHAMQAEKVICGFPTIIDWDKTEEERVTALIEVKISPKRGQGYDYLAERIYKFEEVSYVYLMSADYDLMVIVEGKTMKEVAHFVSSKLSPMDSVLSTATHFVLKKYKERGIQFVEEDKDDLTDCPIHCKCCGIGVCKPHEHDGHHVLHHVHSFVSLRVSRHGLCGTGHVHSKECCDTCEYRENPWIRLAKVFDPEEGFVDSKYHLLVRIIVHRISEKNKKTGDYNKLNEHRKASAHRVISRLGIELLRLLVYHLLVSGIFFLYFLRLFAYFRHADRRHYCLFVHRIKCQSNYNGKNEYCKPILSEQSIKKLQYPSKWLSQNAKHLVFSFTVLRYFRGS